MKIRRIFGAAVAAAVAATTVASVATAETRTIEGKTQWLLDGAGGNYGICLLSDGTNGEGIPEMSIADIGVDPAAVAHMDFTFTVPETDSTGADNRVWWDGQGGGACVMSAHAPDDLTSYNWVSQSGSEWWGVEDEELGLSTDGSKPFATKVGDYTYKLGFDIDNVLAKDPDFAAKAGYVRVFAQSWSFISEIVPVEIVLSDASGNVLVTFDGKGNPTVAGGGSAAGSTTDTTGTTGTTDKGSNPDTGVAGVAAVAGIAVVAAGAIALSKKRG